MGLHHRRRFQSSMRFRNLVRFAQRCSTVVFSQQEGAEDNGNSPPAANVVHGRGCLLMGRNQVGSHRCQSLAMVYYAPFPQDEAEPKSQFVSAGTQFCQNILSNGFGTFLPAILYAMGHDRLSANYLTIPVYVLGAIGFFTFAFLSDKYQKCGPVSQVAA